MSILELIVICVMIVICVICGIGYWLGRDL